MRQRRIKGLEEKLDHYTGGIKADPRLFRGRWQELFAEEQPLYLELGSGKGNFASSKADAFPENNYIAAEGNRSIVLRALQKAARHIGLAPDTPAEREEGKNGPAYTPPLESLVAYGCFAPRTTGGADSAHIVKSRWASDQDDRVCGITDNLVFANTYMRSVTDFFADDELEGLYLNFSDPWPKDRQAFRRLTHRRYLEGYRRILRPGAALEFKTDNEALFRFSVEEFRACHLTITDYTEDLHGKDEDRYETAQFMTEYEAKFSSQGCPIYYCRAEFSKE